MNREVDKLEAKLEMDPSSDTVVGTITGDDGVERPFSGWMELASAVEAWRTENSSRQLDDDGPRRRRPSATERRSPHG